MTAEWWQLAEGWELYDWSLFVDIPAPVEGKDLGGAAPRGRRPRTAVYATAKASLAMPTVHSVAVARPPRAAPAAPVRAPAVVGGSATAVLAPRLTVRNANGQRRTFAAASPTHLMLPPMSASASGSVWTQMDEESELMMLGLFA